MQEDISLQGKNYGHICFTPIMFFIWGCSSQLWKKNSLPNETFSAVNRWCWPGKQGPGNRRVNVNLDSPSQASALSKSGQKIIFQKKYKCANIFTWLLVNFSFWKIQENRGVEVNLGFASASVPRKKSPAASFVSQKISIQCYKIPPWLFRVPKNPVPTFHELTFSFLLP